MTNRVIIPVNSNFWGEPFSAVSAISQSVTTTEPCTLIAFIGYYGATSNPAIASITSSGLTWTPIASASLSDGGGGTNNLKLWWARATSSLTNQVVRCDMADSHNTGFLVYAMKHAHQTSPIGAIAIGTTSSAGTASFTVTGTTPGSLVFLHAVKTNGGASVPGSGTMFIGTAGNSDQNLAVLSERSVRTTTSSSVTLNDYRGSAQYWGYILYELLPNTDPITFVEQAENPVGQPRGGVTSNDALLTTDGPRLLVAAHAFNGGNNCKVNSMTGGGLTWLSSSDPQWPGNNTFGTEIWYAVATGALTSVGITATLNSSCNYAFSVIPFWGHDPSNPIGARVAQQYIANSSVISATLTGCRLSSTIVAAGWTNGGGTVATMAPGTTQIDWQNTAGLFIRTTSGTVSGSNTISASLNSSLSEQYMAAAEFFLEPQGNPYANQCFFVVASDTINVGNLLLPDRSKIFGPTTWFTATQTTFSLGYDYAPDGTRSASRVQIPPVVAAQMSLRPSASIVVAGEEEPLNYFRMKPSTVYTYSVWAKFLADHNQGIGMQIHQYNEGTGYINATSSNTFWDQFTTLNTWARATWSFETFSNTDYAYWNLYTAWSPSTATDALFWGAKMEEGAGATGGPNTYLANPSGSVVGYLTWDGQQFGMNMLRSSQARSIGPDLGGYTWFLQTNITATYNAIAAPNNLIEATRIRWSGNGAEGPLEIAPRYAGDIYIPVSPGNNYCWSMWIKNNGTTGSWSSNMDIGFYDFGKNPLESNWVHAKNISGSLTGSEWCRVFVTGTSPSGTAYALCSNMNGYNPNFALDVYVWGAKLEIAGSPTGDPGSI